MKHSALTSRTSLKRTAMKRNNTFTKGPLNVDATTEKPKKKKKAPEYPTPLQIKGRKILAEQFKCCMACGHPVVHKPQKFTTAAAEVHHIATRKQAPGKFEEPCNWILLCHICHIETVHGTGGNWHITMLAFKKRNDPKAYDLEKWHELAGKPDTYISEHEITAALEMDRYHQSHAFTNDIRAR